MTKLANGHIISEMMPAHPYDMDTEARIDRGQTNFELHPRYDNLFRTFVTGGWATKSEGRTEAPMGHFALMEIEPEDIKELVEAFPEAVTEIYQADEPVIFKTENLAGYYLIKENDVGQIFVFAYDRQANAEAEFNYLAASFAEWDTDGQPGKDAADTTDTDLDDEVNEEFGDELNNILYGWEALP